MDKSKIIFVVIILFVSITIYKINMNKLNNNKDIKETKQNTKVNRKQFAMYIKENGVYKEYTSSDIFPEGYVIDKNMSKCYDAEDQEITGITFTGNSNNITVISGKTAYCYLYFDEPTGGNSILSNLPTNSGLSSSTLGDMRRYQGTSAKNYICVNNDGLKCSDRSDQMYRIIGIVEDGDEEGQIKVMKETKYGSNVQWYSKYDLSSRSSYYCGASGCPEWPDSPIFQMLNTTFLQSLPQKVQDNIVERHWYYGDLSKDASYSDKDANTIYQIETGQINTTYYNNNGGLVTNEKWKKIEGTSKIGLIYLHDYLWQSTQERCHWNQSSSTYSQCRDNGWMHLAKNGNSSDNEWTMSRVGRTDSSSTYVRAWPVSTSGTVANYDLDRSNAIRPVFYLSSDVKIKEGGTGEASNPYILDLS